MDVFLTARAWRGYRRSDFPTDSWETAGGVLHALAGGTVSLTTDTRYGDFDLSLEWRLPVGGNSGVLYRVTEDNSEPWQSGPEMQLVDNSGHPDGGVAETSCGALYALKAPENTPQSPPGLYNIGRISVHDSWVEHWLNGVRVLECDMASEDFRVRVARSKFARFPQFARAAEGHIVLQHHGSEAWFRNIRIEARPPPE